jgi:protein TonB
LGRLNAAAYRFVMTRRQAERSSMFESALLEKHHTIRSRRKSATLVSLIVEIAIIGVLVVTPLLVTQTLPAPKLATMLVAPPPPPPPPPPAASTAVKTVKTTTSAPVVVKTLNALRTPTSIPKKIDMRPEAAEPAPAAPTVGGVPGGVPGGVQGGTIGGVVGGILNSGNNLPAKPKLVKVSQGVSEGLLVHKVTPQYPPIAKQAHVQGSVTLKAIIGKDGKVENVQPQSGSPLLASAAVSACETVAL